MSPLRHNHARDSHMHRHTHDNGDELGENATLREPISADAPSNMTAPISTKSSRRPAIRWSPTSAVRSPNWSVGYVDIKALMDCVVVMSARPQDIIPINALDSLEVKFTVIE